MEVILTRNYEELCELAAGMIAAQIRRKPDSVLGLATGSTPLGVYRRLVELHQKEGLDFSKATTFNLDEYLGLSPAHPQSYSAFMGENLFRHINIPPERVFLPQGLVADAEEHCEWYEEAIRKAGGIDLQLLGVGTDGHIGFNEPGSSLGSRTRVKTLDRQTVRDNARFFAREEEVPHFAVTMGVGTILESHRILLIASGKGKARTCAQFIEGPVTSQVTASALQLHRDATAILDEEAGSQLARREYYNWIRDNKHLVQKYLGR